MSHFEKDLSCDTVYRGRIIDFEVHTVELENGDRATRELIRHHTGGVAVAALDAAGNLLMVRQYRFASAQEMLELPAGKLDPGEAPETCGRRELKEETGCTAGRMTLLNELYPVAPYCTDHVDIFLAEELSEPGAQHLDADEFVTPERIPFAEAVAMATDGRITDAKTQIGILTLLKRRSEF